LFNAINATDQHDAVVANFEQVEHLCDSIGQKALQSVVAADARVLSLLQGAESDEARSITLLLTDATLFEHAVVAAYADRLRNGRSWSAFRINGSTDPDSGPRDLKALEAEIAAALKRPDGTVGKLKVESFERGSFGGTGKAGSANAHYAIYSEEMAVRTRPGTTESG